jgi:hypothetical protein
MKVGDMVRLTMKNGSHFGKSGLLISKKLVPGTGAHRLTVFVESGKIISGVPSRYVEVMR